MLRQHPAEDPYRHLSGDFAVSNTPFSRRRLTSALVVVLTRREQVGRAVCTAAEKRRAAISLAGAATMTNVIFPKVSLGVKIREDWFICQILCGSASIQTKHCCAGMKVKGVSRKASYRATLGHSPSSWHLASCYCQQSSLWVAFITCHIPRLAMIHADERERGGRRGYGRV